MTLPNILMQEIIVQKIVVHFNLEDLFNFYKVLDRTINLSIPISFFDSTFKLNQFDDEIYSFLSPETTTFKYIDRRFILEFALSKIIKNNNLKFAQRLFDYKFDINSIKISFNNFDDPQMNFSHGSILDVTVKFGSLEMVELFLKNGAKLNLEVNDDVEMPLNYAARTNNFKLTKLLLDYRADPNAYEPIEDPDSSYTYHGQKNLYGNYDPAIFHPIINSNFEILKLLVKYRADVNIYNSDSEFPLLKAAQQGEIEIMSYLIKKGAKIQHRKIEDDYERNLLLKQLIHPKAYEWLVDSDLDLNLTKDDIYWLSLD